MTPHISAQKKDIAKIALICGDPMRAKYFSENYLVNKKLINKVRGMYGYTGFLKGTKIKVTVMGHGMGLDSIGIYSFELFKFYDVETIIRFGSAGAYSKDLELFDLIVAENAWTESNFGIAYGAKTKTLKANKELVSLTKKIKTKRKVHFGTVNSSMWFYRTAKLEPLDSFSKKGILAVEMEAYALYAIANALKKRALTILSVSDNLVTKKETTSLQREKGFSDMFNFLTELVKLDNK